MARKKDNHDDLLRKLNNQLNPYYSFTIQKVCCGANGINDPNIISNGSEIDLAGFIYVPTLDMLLVDVFEVKTSTKGKTKLYAFGQLDTVSERIGNQEISRENFPGEYKKTYMVLRYNMYCSLEGLFRKSLGTLIRIEIENFVDALKVCYK